MKVFLHTLFYRYTILFSSLLLFFTVTISAQSFNNLRIKELRIARIVQLDSLSLVPGTLIIKLPDGTILDTNCYTINNAASTLLFSCSEVLGKRVSIYYRVFPFNISATYKHRSLPAKNTAEPMLLEPYKPQQTETEWLNFGTLSKQGSISREVGFGNKQDVVINSNLNLKLNGKLSDDVSVLAAITDNNVPIQPDGYTQQIQDFDKLFIQLNTQRSSIIAGDFELQSRDAYFMQINKKARGALLASSQLFNPADTTKGKLVIKESGSISKGRYVRYPIISIEGMQGPYRLYGADNELYIVVLAGSEKIYIDGELLVRGEDNDYVIDYNTAELSFTVRNPITKDKRIVVEFEYTDKKFARSMFFSSATLVKKKMQMEFNYFTEQDMKNQPLLQELTADQKQVLSFAGDNVESLWYPTINKIDFNNNEVLYKMIDTLAGSVFYDSVFVYSIDKDSATYRLGFTYVGLGKGNYIQEKSLVNGRVFKWVAPVLGVIKGDYEPLMQLTAPQKHQIFSAFAGVDVFKNTKARVEWTMSNMDKNTFSSINSKDNVGFGLRMSIDNKLNFSKHDSAWKMKSGLSYEWVNPLYKPVERYRAIEFERDWAINNLSIKNDEFLSSAYCSLFDPKKNSVSYTLSSLIKGEDFNALKQNVFLKYTYAHFILQSNASIMQSNMSYMNTVFIRQRSGLSKRLGIFEIGVKDNLEHALFTQANTDSLLANASGFNEWEVFVADADSANKRYTVFYKQRIDKLPFENNLKNISLGESVGADFRIVHKSFYSSTFTTAYRRLSILDNTITSLKPDNSFTGRMDNFISALKGAVVSQTFYEAGNSMELKKEYRYIQVPIGQGVYAWTDYNNNGIEELNEFDIAIYKDQANFIRVYTPTNIYVRAFMSSISEMLDINPALKWKSDKRFVHFLTRFSNKSIGSINRKITGKTSVASYLPLSVLLNDTSIISMNSSLRNTIYFNRNSSKFGLEFMYDYASNKSLLMNGYDIKEMQSKSVQIRGTIKQTYLLRMVLTQGSRVDSSEYLSNRNFHLLINEIEPSISYQPGQDYRVVLGYKYSEKKNSANSFNPEQAFINKIFTEVKYNLPSKASVQGRFEVWKINFNASENTSVAYIMLDGLKNGINYTWNISFQKDIGSNIQLNVLYDGRKMEGNKVIHIGNVMVRAFF